MIFIQQVSSSKYKHLRRVLGKFPECIYYFNMNWQIVKKRYNHVIGIFNTFKMNILQLLGEK